MKIIAKKLNEFYILDISLEVGRGRDEKPMAFIEVRCDYWVQCYSLEEFMNEWQIIGRVKNDNSL